MWHLDPGSESEPGCDVEGGSPSGGLDDRNSEQNSNGAYREVGSEGSCMRSLDPRNTKGIRGTGWWARALDYPKPHVIQTTPVYMPRVYEMNVARLTLGDLPSGPCGSEPLHSGPCGRQKSAKASTSQRWRGRAEHDEPDWLGAFDVR